MLRTIRARLTLAYLGLAVIPLCFAGAFFVARSYMDQHQRVFELQNETVQLVAVQIESFIEELERQLYLVIKVRGLLDQDLAQQQIILAELQSFQTIFEELSLLDRNGWERIRVSRLGVILPSDLRDRSTSEEFQQLLHEQQTYFSPIQINEITAEPFIRIAAPIIEPRRGELQGALTADLRFKPVWDLMADIPLGTGATVYLVNDQDVVVAHRNPSIVLKKTAFKVPPDDGVHAGLSGEQAVLAVAELSFGKQKFRVVAERTLEAALAPLFQQTIPTVVGFIVLALLVASAVAVFTLRRIVQPIQTLAATANAISEGDLAQRAEIQSDDEVGGLAGAFNQMTQQLQTLIDNLEDKVNERTADLQNTLDRLQATQAELIEAKDRAEQASQAKSEFLSNMNHELRTPLNAILGYTQILKNQPDLSESKSISDSLAIIDQSGNHLLNLINSVLDLSKIEAKHMTLNPTTVNLPKFLQGIVDIHQIRAQEKNVRFQFNVSESLPIDIVVDETKLRQIIINLLSNAIKFTEQGYVALQVDAQQVDVQQVQDQTAERTDVYLCFSVEDTGPGMTTAELQHIFSPFEQAGRLSKRSEGTGLGLSISQRLVGLMGGELKVRSKPGQGSRFWFELNVMVSEPQPAKVRSQQAIIGYKGSRRRVLIVDDVGPNRWVLRGMLEPLGFNIAEADDGRSALQKAQAIRPDILLIDMIMPDLSGHETVRMLRQQPAFQQTPVIAISASNFVEDREQSRAVGCDAFLAKPIVLDELLRELKYHLQLDWYYQQAFITQTALTTNTPLSSELIAPCAKSLIPIYQSAQLGRMSKVRQYAHELSALDGQYEAFAKHLQALAKEFRQQDILIFLKPYLKDHKTDL